MSALPAERCDLNWWLGLSWRRVCVPDRISWNRDALPEGEQVNGKEN